MGKYIHVPQGRSAHLISLSTLLDITGLYTSEYSTCCIIAAVSTKAERMCLMHIDAQTVLEMIKEEIESIGSDVEVLLLYREEFKDSFFIEFQAELKSALPNIKIKTKTIDMEHDGVILPLKALKADSIESVIDILPLYENAPEELMRHPQEQQFLATQKIEQVIGARERYHTKLVCEKYINIFDGLTWELIPHEELQVNKNYDLTRQEMNFFNPHDNYLSVCDKIERITSEIKKLMFVPEDFTNVTMDIAIWLEGYMNDFNPDILLLRDTKQIVDPTEERNIYYMNLQKTKEDQDFSMKLFRLLLEKTCSVSQIMESISAYKNMPHESKFKRQLLNEFTTYHRHYLQRKMYEEMDSKNKALLNKARESSKQAVDRFQKKDYEAAANLFLDILKVAWQCCLKSSKEMVTIFYNLGRSHQMCKRYAAAKPCLTYALQLRTSYPKQNATTENDIKKTKKVIEECEGCLSQSEEVVAERGASPVPVLGGGM